MAEEAGRTKTRPSADLPVVRWERRDVFLSYAREDGAVMRRLLERLRIAELDVYVDFDAIPDWSDDWQAELFAQIDASDAIVVILSPAAVESSNVFREVEHAVAQGKRLIALQIADVDHDRVPEVLSVPQWLDCRGERGIEERFDALLNVLSTNVGWVREHTRFLLDANDWSARGQDRTLLLGRSDLRDAERWLADQGGKAPPPTDLQMRFIVASRTAAARRRRNLSIAVLATLAVSIGLTVYAVVQQRRAEANARASQSRALTASSVAANATDPQLGVLLAQRAIAIERRPEAVLALRRAVESSPILFMGRGNGGALGAGGAFATWRGERLEIWDWRRWDWRDRKPTVTIHARAGRIADAVFDPAARLLAVADGEGAAVRRVSDGAVVAQLRHGERVSQVTFSRDGRTVLAAVADHGSVLWRWETRESGHRVTPARARSAAAAFGMDGRAILARTVVNAPGAEGGLSSLRPSEAHDELSADGRALLTERLGVTVSAATDGRELATLSSEWPSTAARFAGDGRTVGVAELDGAIGTWDWRTNRVSMIDRSRGLATTLTFNAAGDVMAAAGETGIVTLWDWRRRLALVDLRGATSSIVDLELDATGAVVMARDADRRILVWRGKPVPERHVRDRPGWTIQAATTSRGGRLLALATDAPSGDGVALSVWDTTGWSRLARRVMSLPDSVDSLELTDTLVTVRQADATRRWAWRHGPRDLPSAPARRLVLRDATIAVHDPRGRELIRLDRPDGPSAAALSANGRLLAVGVGDATVKVWDVDRHAVIASLASGWRVTSLAFGLDDRYLALTPFSHLGVTQIWDIETGQVIARLPDRELTPSKALWSGRKLLVHPIFGDTVRVYACELCIPSRDLDSVAARHVARTLTARERATYLR